MRYNYEVTAHMDNIFTLDEMEKIKAAGEDSWEVGSVGGGNEADTTLRNCRVAWLYAEDYGWVFDAMIRNMDTLNRTWLHMDWDLTLEPLQLTEYKEGAFYVTHTDVGGGKMLYRKVSASVLLNDDYEGGVFKLHTRHTPEVVEVKAGRMIAFPSYVLHEVTPVTSGVRYSLVAWGQGPRFR